MAIDLQNRENIQTGWPGPPKFDAPNIGGLVGEILRNKLLRDKMTGENISEAIKNMRQEHQANAYLDAAKEAGLVPQDYEAGGMGGATMAATLAKQIMAQKVADARAGLIGAQTEKAQTIADYIKQYGHTPGARGGSGGGGSYDVPDEPETYTDPQGRVWQKTRTGWKTLPVGLQPSDTRTQNENQMLKEQAGLLEQKGQMEGEISTQRDANIAAKKADVPYSRSDEYNRTVNRLKQLQQSKVIPSTQPDAAPQPSPAETGDALPTSSPRPSSYASPDQIRMARARQAMDDPQATPEEKEQARKILAGE